MPGKKPRHQPGEPPIRTIDYTVDGNGCWVWNWAVQRKGYASVWIDGRGVKAHRVAYELANGPIPEGMVIRHTCGNPSCVNAEHLRVGTRAENARDMVNDGNQGNQKFLPSDAAEIRRLFAAGGISRREIARQYGVEPAGIGSIIANETFPDPDYTPPPKVKRAAAHFLGPEKARQIRQLYAEGGMSQRELADRFAISLSAVSQIVRNQRYPDPDYVVPERKAVNQKLTKAQADEIREKIRQGATLSALAKEYGVNQATISHIKSGKIHHGIPRQYPVNEYAESPPRPTLNSADGPAPTGQEKQAERLGEINPDIRPKRRPGQPYITEKDWALDPDTGCHNWRWADGTKEYRGLINFRGRRRLPYHVSWELSNGPIPQGSQINHRCNNGRCINVSHLYLGDQLANVRDIRRASNLAMQKLTWEQVKEIRERYAPGKISHEKLAREYKVTAAAIRHIIINKTFHDPGYTPKTTEVSVRRVLTDVDAATIRRRYCAEPIGMSDLAREFDVSLAVITGIIHNKTYRDADYTPPTSDFIRQRWGAVASKKISAARRAAEALLQQVDAGLEPEVYQAQLGELLAQARDNPGFADKLAAAYAAYELPAPGY